jgi:hypothetical protein
MKGLHKREAYRDALTNAAEMIRGHAGSLADDSTLGDYAMKEYEDACYRVFLKLETLAKKEQNNIAKILFP